MIAVKPVSIQLGANYPNPFNPSTTIPLFLSSDSHVKITVYNVIGQRVDEIFSGELKSGTHRFMWDGRDQNGNEVPSGVYFYRAMAASGESVVHKMLLLK